MLISISSSVLSRDLIFSVGWADVVKQYYSLSCSVWSAWDITIDRLEHVAESGGALHLMRQNLALVSKSRQKGGTNFQELHFFLAMYEGTKLPLPQPFREWPTPHVPPSPTRAALRGKLNMNTPQRNVPFRGRVALVSLGHSNVNGQGKRSNTIRERHEGSRLPLFPLPILSTCFYDRVSTLYLQFQSK